MKRNMQDGSDCTARGGGRGQVCTQVTTYEHEMHACKSQGLRQYPLCKSHQGSPSRLERHPVAISLNYTNDDVLVARDGHSDPRETTDMKSNEFICLKYCLQRVVHIYTLDGRHNYEDQD